MGKSFRPSTRESRIISEIELSRELAKKNAINRLRDCVPNLSNALSMKLVESKLIETNNKNSIQEQMEKCLTKLIHADDFDIDYQIAPIRNIVSNGNIISLYLTAYIIEHLINHRDIIDIYGSDEEIYSCVDKQVNKYLS